MSPFLQLNKIKYVPVSTLQYHIEGHIIEKQINVLGDLFTTSHMGNK